MTTQQKIDEARDWIRRTRRELDGVEDVLTHAGSFRGGAFITSLQQTFNHAESAKIHAVQLAVAKVGE
jgi:hypothetical protein